jgi:hypothetical protein
LGERGTDELTTPMPARLLIAYVLMLLMAAGWGGVIWWKIYHSRARTFARELARQRRSDAARAKGGDGDG